MLPSGQCCTAIFTEYSSCLTGILCPVISNPLHLPPSGSWQPLPLSEFMSLTTLGFSYMWRLTQYCLSVTDSFYLAWCFSGSAMLWHVLVVHSFLRLNSIPPYTTYFLSSHLLMEICIVSILAVANSTAMSPAHLTTFT